MKIGMVSKLTKVNIFVFHTSHEIITNLAILIRKTTKKFDLWGSGKKAVFCSDLFIKSRTKTTLN